MYEGSIEPEERRMNQTLVESMRKSGAVVGRRSDHEKFFF